MRKSLTNIQKLAVKSLFPDAIFDESSFLFISNSNRDLGIYVHWDFDVWRCDCIVCEPRRIKKCADFREAFELVKQLNQDAK